MERALDPTIEGELHVVPEIIESELVVGTVGDVCVVAGPTLGIAEVVDDHTGLHSQPTVELTHPLRITARQVVIDRDHVYAFALQSVQIDRQSGHKGLALTGLHLGDGT